MSNDDLIAYWNEHVCYEVYMLNGTAEILTTSGIVLATLQHSGIVKDAILESFLAHARNILGFFRKQGNRNTDIWAGSYFKEFEIEIERVLVCKDDDDDKIFDDISKKLSHLAGARTTKTQWDIDDLIGRVHRRLEIFQNQLITAYPGCRKL